MGRDAAARAVTPDLVHDEGMMGEFALRAGARDSS